MPLKISSAAKWWPFHAISRSNEFWQSWNAILNDVAMLKESEYKFQIMPALSPWHMMTSSNGNIFRVTGHFAGNSPGTSDAELWCFFFNLRLNKRFSKQSRDWWFETPAWSFWRHRNYHIHTIGVKTCRSKGVKICPSTSILEYTRRIYLASGHNYMTWWRQHMETLLDKQDLCERKSLVTRGFPQRAIQGSGVSGFLTRPNVHVWRHWVLHILYFNSIFRGKQTLYVLLISSVVITRFNIARQFAKCILANVLYR